MTARLDAAGRETRSALDGKYLTFSLGEEQYGIGILKVREIIGMMPITPVPLVPSFLKGVINLRGKVIPVVDLRRKLGMPDADVTERTCIIVVETNGCSNLVQTGAVVDSVCEVLTIKPSEIEDPSGFGTGIRSDYILGIAKTEGKIKILLDIGSVLRNWEMNPPEETD